MRNWIWILCLSFSGISIADTQREINHLMSFVGATECQYERNGKRHSGNEAVKHIKKKYDYFIEDIDSTEGFIKYAATKSKMSGKYYWVHCKGQRKMKSRDWLLAELAAFRSLNK